ncbi:MAG: hypothetical protein JJ959_06780 [Nisaea sp.]|uniref:hypothetical protein n=1 Tax=Nisaea sp. TaxID=2024842 RepID=UPI001B2DE2D0|nr:hypothetical protein [Nisaea sp.]MBO6560223.1 hypothetical protein [Nisaea sp.]
MPTYVITPELSTEQYEQIGKVMAAWAYLESSIDRSIWRILDADNKTGRIITTRINMRSKLIMLRLLFDRHINDEKAGSAISTLEKYVEEVQTWRNHYAHGLWGKHPETGNFNVIWYTGGKKDQNRIYGQSAEAEAKDIGDVASCIFSLIGIADALERRLSVLRGVSSEVCEQPHEDIDPQDQVLESISTAELYLPSKE